MIKKSLAVTVILLFIGMSVVPSTAVKELREKPFPINFDGNTLYVGGSGPNNYTTIQSAVDAASDGDTVFVYDDSSPYYENLVVNKSINLSGEDRNTTIIDGGNHPDNYVIWVEDTNSVIISGFTTQNGRGIKLLLTDYSLISDNLIGPHTGGDEYCIRIEGEGNIIEDNVISSADIGIYLWYGSGSYIINNSIISHRWGIYAIASNDNHIIGNIFSDNDYGMELFGCVNNNIHENTIVDNDIGIFSRESEYTFISKNVITSNNRGILFSADSNYNNVSNNSISNNRVGIMQFGGFQFWHPFKSNTHLQIVHNEIINNDEGVSISADGNVVSCNNFIDNDRQASFIATIRNEWDANYWSDSQKDPYVIWGRIGIIFNFIPWRDYDYNPAQEPYDIEV